MIDAAVSIKGPGHPEVFYFNKFLNKNVHVIPSRFTLYHPQPSPSAMAGTAALAVSGETKSEAWNRGNHSKD